MPVNQSDGDRRSDGGRVGTRGASEQEGGESDAEDEP